MSTSPSPAKVPPVIFTVALAILRLSTSDTVSVGEICRVVPAVNVTVGATAVRVGASLMPVMLTVVVATALWMLKSSATVQVTVRVGSEPKSVGLWLVVPKVTESSTRR